MPKRDMILGVVLLLATAGHAFPETIGYAYDTAGRLTHAHYPDSTIEYVYDPAGNLLSRVVTSGGVSPSPIEPTMTAQRTAGQLSIAYSIEGCTATDHVLFVGTLEDFASVASADCSVGNSGETTVPLPPGDVWFLVAGLEGTSYSSVGYAIGGDRTLAGVAAACPDLTADSTRTCP